MWVINCKRGHILLAAYLAPVLASLLASLAYYLNFKVIFHRCNALWLQCAGALHQLHWLDPRDGHVYDKLAFSVIGALEGMDTGGLRVLMR